MPLHCCSFTNVSMPFYIIIQQRSSHIYAIYGNRIRARMECWILTSKNLAKLKQYYYFHAEFLEVLSSICVLIFDCRELDHAMLQRLEKRILVDLPNEEARCAMFKHHLPPLVTPPPFSVTSQVDYATVAKVHVQYTVCIQCTVWLLSAQIWMGRRTYGALVQFGCYQHRCEWKGLWCSSTVWLLSIQT